MPSELVINTIATEADTSKDSYTDHPMNTL